jgi:hypothetical protein
MIIWPGQAHVCRSARPNHPPVHEEVQYEAQIGKLRHSPFLRLRTDKPALRGRAGGALITHPEKVLSPDDGITKGELASITRPSRPLWCRMLI